MGKVWPKTSCNHLCIHFNSWISFMWISLFHLNTFHTDWLDSSASPVICVQALACLDWHSQSSNRQACVDINFGDALNPSVNKRGFRRFTENHPLPSYLHPQHWTCGGWAGGWACSGVLQEQSCRTDERVGSGKVERTNVFARWLMIYRCKKDNLEKIAAHWL